MNCFILVWCMCSTHTLCTGVVYWKYLLKHKCKTQEIYQECKTEWRRNILKGKYKVANAPVRFRHPHPLSVALTQISYTRRPLPSSAPIVRCFNTDQSHPPSASAIHTRCPFFNTDQSHPPSASVIHTRCPLF